jgi:hypothetical protein
MSDSAQVRLSPELESAYEVAARHLEDLIRWATDNDYDSRRNEATTRLQTVWHGRSKR